MEGVGHSYARARRQGLVQLAHEVPARAAADGDAEVPEGGREECASIIGTNQNSLAVYVQAFVILFNTKSKVLESSIGNFFECFPQE